MSANTTTGLSRVFSVRVPHDEYERWRQEAEEAGMNFNSWIRTRVNGVYTEAKRGRPRQGRVLALNPGETSWYLAEPMKEPWMWKVWRFLRLMK